MSLPRMLLPRLWEVEVKATVYVLAATEHEAERIACSQTDTDWLRGWAFERPVGVRDLDYEWRDVPPLRGDDADGDERTCREIAEAEALAREVAARQARLPGVEP